MRSLSILLVLALLPTALASWQSSVVAPSEPSTARDAFDGFMFHDPPIAEDRVHLDLVYVPASAAKPTPHVEAILGAWRDCNGDGVVGSVAGDDFPALLLQSFASCPPGSRHNDGATVRELLAIGPGAAYPDLADADAAVWMDALLEGETPPVVKWRVDDLLTYSVAERRWIGERIWIQEPVHQTAYAHVGIATTSTVALPMPSSASYGAAGCGGGSGGWFCNPAQWPNAPRVGDPYELRDTDCPNDPAC